jgi:putative transposase
LYLQCRNEVLILLFMSRKYKFNDKDKLYFVSFAVINWIDLFVRKEYKNVVVSSLRYCIEKKDLELYAWCIMTSHVHLIIGSANTPLENIMRDLKRHTSEELHKMISHNPHESRKEWLLEMMEKAGKENSNNCGFQLWQQHNHPIVLATPQITHQKLNYLHNNPIAEGFVEKPEDWLYSSAANYHCGTKGMIDVMFIDPMLITY